ncbi:carbohydrate-binding module 1 protein [Apophysomyces ossiformis]|uniref:Carbohydrate-binding module 1 protein n=1 Tax=Apophysomyces ossiformis TaxID=679940 RepID=A0A8H7BXB2_9FUNG|nr:carbohydrate-binding module 1 protein [Apophysomyces ossiformis]
MHNTVQSVATNTLLVPNVPRPFFSCPSAMKLIKSKFEQFGTVHDFIAMKGFARLMIVYEETMAAMAAKEAMDKTMLLWKMVGEEINLLSLDNEMALDESTMSMAIRIYYGQHNPINPDPNLMRLQIPDPGRNFLISPPGAPFEDWKQTQESPPNKAVLASDLMHAVADVSDDDMDDLEDFSLDHPANESDKLTPTLKIVLGEEQADHLPVITVQDYDGGKGNLDVSKKNNRLPFPKATAMPTPRPPLFS